MTTNISELTLPQLLEYGKAIAQELAHKYPRNIKMKDIAELWRTESSEWGYDRVMCEVNQAIGYLKRKRREKSRPEGEKESRARIKEEGEKGSRARIKEERKKEKERQARIKQKIEASKAGALREYASITPRGTGRRAELRRRGRMQDAVKIIKSMGIEASISQDFDGLGTLIEDLPVYTSSTADFASFTSEVDVSIDEFRYGLNTLLASITTKEGPNAAYTVPQWFFLLVTASIRELNKRKTKAKSTMNERVKKDTVFVISSPNCKTCKVLINKLNKKNIAFEELIFGSELALMVMRAIPVNLKEHPLAPILIYRREVRSGVDAIDAVREWEKNNEKVL